MHNGSSVWISKGASGNKKKDPFSWDCKVKAAALETKEKTLKREELLYFTTESQLLIKF